MPIWAADRAQEISLCSACRCGQGFPTYYEECPRDPSRNLRTSGSERVYRTNICVFAFSPLFGVMLGVSCLLR